MECTGLPPSDLGETEEMKTKKTASSSGSLPEHMKGDGPNGGKNNRGGVRLVNISVEFHPDKNRVTVPLFHPFPLSSNNKIGAQADVNLSGRKGLGESP